MTENKKIKDLGTCLFCRRGLYEDSFWFDGIRYTNHPGLICMRCSEGVK